MATNPNAIFSAALANGPHVEPFDVGTWMDQRSRSQALTAEAIAATQQTQQQTQSTALENQKAQINLKADQAVRDAIQKHTRSLPVTPPPAGFPAPPTDADGKPVQDPNYQGALAASAVQAPWLDVHAAAADLAASGHGDRALTLLKTDQENTARSLTNAKDQLANTITRNGAEKDAWAGLMTMMKPSGPDSPADPAAVAKAQQLYPDIAARLKRDYGVDAPAQFDPSFVETRWRGLAGQEGVNKAIADHLANDKTQAATKSELARSEESTAGARKTAAEAQKLEDDRKIRQQFMDALKNTAPGAGDPLADAVSRVIDKKKHPKEWNAAYGVGQNEISSGGSVEGAFQQVRTIADQVLSSDRELENAPKRAYADAQASQRGQADLINPGDYIDALGKYQVPMSELMSRMPGVSRQKLLNAVLAKYPDFQESNYKNYSRTEEQFTTGKQGDTVRFNNNVIEHLGMLDEAGKALNNGKAGLPILNRIANELGYQAGGDAKSQYELISGFVGDEVAKANGENGVSERAEQKRKFGSDLNDTQRTANIRGALGILGAQQTNLEKQYQRGTYGRGTQKLWTDEATATRERLMGKAGTTPTVTTKADYDKLPSGAQYIDSQDGKPYTKK